MAKSRKSRKATDKVEESVEVPKIVDAEPSADQDADASLKETKAEEAAESSEQLSATEPEVKDDKIPPDAEEHAAESSASEASPEPEPQPETDSAAEQAAPDETVVDDGQFADFEAEGSSDNASGDEDRGTAQEDSDASELASDEPEEVQAAPPPPPETRIVRGSAWPGIFGGIVAAALGFIVGRGDALDEYLPASMQRTTVDVTAIEEQLGTLSAQSTELTAQTEAQATRLAALEETSASMLAEGVETLEAQMSGLAERLSAVEARPIAENDGASTEDVSDLQAAFEAQSGQIAELTARAEEAEAAAAGEAARILARAAMTRVVTAVDSGESFAPALRDLEDVAPVEVPEPLRDAAEDGVPTMGALQTSFPDAARSGLAAARSEVPEADVDGITGFLKRQLNVRSVMPREGTDPDAILSRAQAAVSAGDLGTALTEMEGLPEAARVAMSDWLEAASARKAAQDAASELADSLNSN